MVYRVIGVAAVGLLAIALYWTVRLERADWLFVKGGAPSIRQAIALAPGTAEYYSSLAQAEPNHAVEILRDGAALNPLNSSLRLELGLAAEQQGDFHRAEISLLEATRLDTGFGPRWALSDFYLHRRDVEKFWPAVKAALAISYGDVSDQFRNCWALTSDPQIILDSAIPDRPAVWLQYLDFLLREGPFDAAEPVASKVLETADRETVPALLKYCDRQLEKGRGEQALLVWNGLARRKLIPYAELAAGAGEVPVNGDFRLPELGHAFDWRISAANGIDVDRILHPSGHPSGLRIRFSGMQPESTGILSQYVPLLPHRRYVLTVRYRVSGIGAESGLMCTLESAGQDLLKGRGLLRGSTQTFPFQTPDGVTLGRLALAYHRMPGATRIEGSLTLESFALTLGPGDNR